MTVKCPCCGAQITILKGKDAWEEDKVVYTKRRESDATTDGEQHESHD